MSVSVDAKASAALSICESLLLCLTDLKVVKEDDVVALLWDAVAAHRRSALEIGDAHAAAVHMATAELIAAIIDGGNSVRRR